jgi:hypothetical protein
MPLLESEKNCTINIWISYSPNNKEEGGFHEIVAEVSSHPEVKKVQTRPGYWPAAKP